MVGPYYFYLAVISPQNGGVISLQVKSDIALSIFFSLCFFIKFLYKLYWKLIFIKMLQTLDMQIYMFLCGGDSVYWVSDTFTKQRLTLITIQGILLYNEGMHHRLGEIRPLLHLVNLCGGVLCLIVSCLVVCRAAVIVLSCLSKPVCQL